MISRRTWTDAIGSSSLPATVRAVLREMAVGWPHGTTRPVLAHKPGQGEPRSWQAHLAARTGLSVPTIRRCWRAAEDAGFLVLVTDRRQHYAPEYAPTIPPAQTDHPDRSEDSQTDHPDRSEDAPTGTRPITVSGQTDQPDRSLIGVQTKEPPTPTPPPTDVVADAGSAVVVVAELPRSLARSVRRSVLAEALAGAAALGWTRDQLAAAARAHDWTGARHGGAVVEWARDLATAPPQPVAAPAPAQLCEIHGTRHRGVCSGCRADAIAAPRAGAG